MNLRRRRTGICWQFSICCMFRMRSTPYWEVYRQKCQFFPAKVLAINVEENCVHTLFQSDLMFINITVSIRLHFYSGKEDSWVGRNFNCARYDFVWKMGKITTWKIAYIHRPVLTNLARNIQLKVRFIYIIKQYANIQKHRNNYNNHELQNTLSPPNTVVSCLKQTLKIERESNPLKSKIKYLT